MEQRKVIVSHSEGRMMDDQSISSALTDEQINTLRQQYGVTSNGRGIREFTQVCDFARAIVRAAAELARATAQKG